MTLKRVYSNIIPFQGYVAMTLYPWVFIRKSAAERYTEAADRHEATHGYQQIETLWVLFFLIYLVEYLVKLVITFDHRTAYRSISFEQEAYMHEDDASYNSSRKHYTWVKYIFKLK